MNIQKIGAIALVLTMSSIKAAVLIPETIGNFYTMIERHPFDLMHCIKSPYKSESSQIRTVKATLCALSCEKKFQRTSIFYYYDYPYCHDYLYHGRWHVWDAGFGFGIGGRHGGIGFSFGI
jgi:hypothetical protein